MADSATKAPWPLVLPKRPNWSWWLYGIVMSSIAGAFAGLVMALLLPVTS